MSLWISNTSVVPANGWRYPHVSPDHFIYSFNWDAFYLKIKQTYEANNVTPPTQQDVIDYVCANQSVPCYEGKDALVNKFTLGLPEPRPTVCCGGPVIPFPKGVVP